MMNLGWQCPACQRVYAPHVNECANCAARAAVPAGLPYPTYPGTAPFVPPHWPTTVCFGVASGAALDCVGRNDGVGKVSFEACAYDTKVATLQADIGAANAVLGQLATALSVAVANAPDVEGALVDLAASISGRTH